jgi:hypothetical protein
MHAGRKQYDSYNYHYDSCNYHNDSCNYRNKFHYQCKMFTIFDVGMLVMHLLALLSIFSYDSCNYHHDSCNYRHNSCNYHYDSCNYHYDSYNYHYDSCNYRKKFHYQCKIFTIFGVDMLDMHLLALFSIFSYDSLNWRTIV